MIVGIGIDSVEINRFAHWATFSHKALSRIFSDDEIAYCLAISIKSAERFAVRFAAREACFKALSGLLLDNSLSFLTLCRALSVAKKNGIPYIIFNPTLISSIALDSLSGLSFHLSLTHTSVSAAAFVVVEKI